MVLGRACWARLDLLMSLLYRYNSKNKVICVGISVFLWIFLSLCQRPPEKTHLTLNNRMDDTLCLIHCYL